MSSGSTFSDFVGRLRAGDGRAADELVARFAPLIRIEVRRRLNDPDLDRAFDSEDVCQSVLASFFFRLAGGAYDLHDPDQLRALLLQMARNKLVNRVRHERGEAARPRPERRDADALAFVPHGRPPDEIAEWRELLSRFLDLLSPEERLMADLRLEGRTWSEIAAHLGGQPQARMRQYLRAVDRAARHLGIRGEEDGDDSE